MESEGAATANLTAAGFEAARWQQATFRIADLPGVILGSTYRNDIWIDANTARHGWHMNSGSGESSFEGVDLLTLIMHELGHVLGYASMEPALRANDGMTATLGTGVRLPGRMRWTRRR